MCFFVFQPHLICCSNKFHVCSASAARSHWNIYCDAPLGASIRSQIHFGASYTQCIRSDACRLTLGLFTSLNSPFRNVSGHAPSHHRPPPHAYFFYLNSAHAHVTDVTDFMNVFVFFLHQSSTSRRPAWSVVFFLSF